MLAPSCMAAASHCSNTFQRHGHCMASALHMWSVSRGRMQGDMPFMVDETKNSRGARLRVTEEDARDLLQGVRHELEVRGPVQGRERTGRFFCMDGRNLARGV